MPIVRTSFMRTLKWLVVCGLCIGFYQEAQAKVARSWSIPRPTQKKKASTLPSGTSLLVWDTRPFLLQAYWSKMKKSKMSLEKHPKYGKYYSNATPAVPKQAYVSKYFSFLLPKKPVKVGDIWQVDSNQREIFQLLNQFHPRISTKLHNGGPNGMFVALQALSKEFAVVIFRLHAELVMVPKKVFYTPGQFAGKMVIHRKSGRVVYFRTYLPKRSLNVDLNADSLIEVVEVPRMELLFIPDRHNKKLHQKWQKARWTKKVDETKLRHKISQKFYAFQKIRFVPFRTALVQAQRQNKPIHVIVIFGPLDDQAC